MSLDDAGPKKTHSMLPACFSRRTPSAILTTSRFAVPHLTVDRLVKIVFDKGRCRVAGVQLFLDKFYENPGLCKTVRMPIADFANLKGLPVILGLEEGLAPSLPLSNGAEHVTVENMSGATRIAIKDFSDLAARLSPDALILPHDRPKAGLFRSPKNILKTAQRTRSYIEQTQAALPGPIPSFIPVCGPDVVLDQVPPASKDAVGYILYGFGADSPELDTVLAHLHKQALPIFIRGQFNPDQVISLVDRGISLFDTSYVNALTASHQALLLDELDEASSAVGYQVLSLASDCFFQDLSPLSSSCGCPTCLAGVSRAYLHHLVACREMLAGVQLQTHNLHQYLVLLDRLGCSQH